MPLLAEIAGSAATALNCLSTPVRQWFMERYGKPTAAQRLAWPVVARSENLLIAAPTGTGKTLAGLLPMIDRIREQSSTGLCCLYVAPLKALVQDTCQTLHRHARQVDGPDRVTVCIGMRSGDTPSHVRKRQLDEPPHVLCTTPETLAVLLASPRARSLFRSLRWVVVDEVHALAPTKRGADLALSLERLETLADRPAGLQRIGLSATCSPLTLAAQYLVGVGRSCRIAQVEDRSRMTIRVEPLAFDSGRGFMNRLVNRLDTELAVNRTTLIFANTRSLTERITWALRKRYPEHAQAIAAHHSALAAERRREVERSLKRGEMWAVVSSTSLELGIDIGSVDGVVFVHPPGSVVRMLQRLGRSGHRPSAPRRGLVLTCSARALIEATVTASCSQHDQIEELGIPHHPADVLCQHVAGMAITQEWNEENAYALIRRAFPYRDLPRNEFHACLDYLSGRWTNGELGLPARLLRANGAFRIADDRTTKLLRRNFGTIIRHEPCAVRKQLPTADIEQDPPRTELIGEVEEAYADRVQPGDRFMLDGRCLELRQRDGKSLLVDEVLGRPDVPRWHGSGPPMSSELARHIYLFRAQAAEALRESPQVLRHMLRDDYRLDDPAIAMLAHCITRQETLSEVPDLGTLLIERLTTQACIEYYVHTPLPCPANEAVLRVVSERLRRNGNAPVVAMAADLGFMVVLPATIEMTPAAWRTVLHGEAFAADLAVSLHESMLLRERFGEVAQTGLLVLRNGGRPNAERWDMEPLFDRVRRLAPDFVLLGQAERETVAGPCDLGTAIEFATQLSRMEIRVRWLAEPSPFADSLLASHRGAVE